MSFIRKSMQHILTLRHTAHCRTDRIMFSTSLALDVITAQKYLPYILHFHFKHRPFANRLHLTLLPAILVTSVHVLHHFSAASKTVIFQVCFGLPPLLAVCGFQSNACFSMDPSSFLGLWPIHCDFLIVMCNVIGMCKVAPHSYPEICNVMGMCQVAPQLSKNL
jgi:hypothetical protein